jgi:hypothetical protein
MKRRAPLFVIIMLVMIFLSSCSSKQAKPVNEKGAHKKEVYHEFFTAEEKKKMGIADGRSVEIHSSPRLKNQYFVKVVDDVDWFEDLYWY